MIIIRKESSQLTVVPVEDAVDDGVVAARHKDEDLSDRVEEYKVLRRLVSACDVPTSLHEVLVLNRGYDLRL